MSNIIKMNLTNCLSEKDNILNNIRNHLTSREKESLMYLLQGKSAKQIAKNMHLSHRTVEFYLDNIRKKLNVPSRLSLISILKLSDIEILCG